MEHFHLREGVYGVVRLFLMGEEKRAVVIFCRLLKDKNILVKGFEPWLVAFPSVLLLFC